MRFGNDETTHARRSADEGGSVTTPVETAVKRWGMTTRNNTLTPSHRRGDTARPLRAETIGDALAAAAAAAPDRAAVIEGAPDARPRRQLTFAELLDLSLRVAGALQARFRFGERVALWAANSLEWTVSRTPRRWQASSWCP